VLLARVSFLPTKDLIFNQFGRLDSILVPNHRIDYETYMDFESLAIPKKVTITNEFYEITFSLKIFEKI
jgi:hypothetical protein